MPAHPFPLRFPLWLLTPVAGVVATAPSSAQTASAQNEGLVIQAVSAASGAYQISWWGRSGRTYFIQHSFDLNSAWSYFPVIEGGQDAVLHYGFSTASPCVFVRLRYVDEALADPYSVDSDGDGLTNREEFELETDPFSPDTDGDLLPDRWEADHGLDPLDPSDAFADPDGDGLSNRAERTLGSDPQDYYNGVTPSIATISGGGQAGPPGHFLPKALCVQVRNPAGAVLINAPVRFSVPQGEGGFASSPYSADVETTLIVRTDSLGLAWVYWKL